MSSQTPPRPRTDVAAPETHPASQATPSGPAASPDAATVPLQPGAQPVPDYELVRRLGGGGFGEVWLARDAGGLEVALKFVRLDGKGSDLELRALDVMKNVRHPNVVSIFRVWRQPERLI